MYKVTLYQRANYPNGGQVLLDTSSGVNPGVTAAVCEPRLNEAGSFTFAVAKCHPLYDSLAAMETYVSVEEDGDEIFYGRIIMIQKNRISGLKQVTCEGAFAFLLDTEMDEDSSEITNTVRTYFGRCIDYYNADINQDAARKLGVGIVTIADADVSGKYKNTSVTQIQNVIRSKLMNLHDGFIHITREETRHYINWVAQVGADNPQPIAIAQNVISQNTNESGEDIFTMMRPQGNDKLRVDPIPLSEAMVAKYGRIFRTVNFDANSASSLRTKANEYIAKIRDRLSLTGEIGFVDMKYLDGTSPKVRTGDVFTHIIGYEGTRFIADSVKRDLLNPANDKLSLKTEKDLMNTANSNGANSGSSALGGAGGGAGRSFSGSGSKWYKFIHETDTDLALQAKNIEITAEEKISQNARAIENNAEEISNVSAVANRADGKWTTFEGTGLYQNRESITAVAGKFKIDNSGKLVLKEGTDFRVSADGTSTNVGRLIFEQDNRVGDMGQLLLGYQGSYSYQHDNEIGALVGAYETNTYQDPQNPYKAVTPPSGANPKELGYYEKVGNDYVLTSDETVQAGKTYYVSNDVTDVIYKGGGGYKIRKNGVEYGIYDGENLTGGLIVEKLNDGTTTTKIKGTRVVIGNDVDVTTLPAWAETTTGLIAEKATIVDLRAVEARVGTLEADAITATTLSSQVLDAYYLNIINGLQINNNATLLVTSGGHLTVPSSALTITSGSGEQSVSVHPNVFLKDVQIIQVSGTNNYKLQYKTAFSSSWSDAGTFSRATSLSGDWGGTTTYTVTASPQGNTLTTSVYQTIEAGALNINQTALAKIYHTNPADPTNQIGSPVEMTLSENVNARKVSLLVNTLEKAQVSTQATFEAGQQNIINAGGPITKTTNTSGAETINQYVTTLTVNVPGKIAKGNWSSGSITFTPSTSGSNSASVNLDADDPVWNGNVATVAVYDGDPGASGSQNTGFSVTVNATSKINTAWNNGGATANVTSAVKISSSDIPSGVTPQLLDFNSYYKLTGTYTNSSGQTIETGNAKYIQIIAPPGYTGLAVSSSGTGAIVGASYSSTTTSVPITLNTGSAPTASNPTRSIAVFVDGRTYSTLRASITDYSDGRDYQKSITSAEFHHINSGYYIAPRDTKGWEGTISYYKMGQSGQYVVLQDTSGNTLSGTPRYNIESSSAQYEAGYAAGHEDGVEEGIAQGWTGCYNTIELAPSSDRSINPGGSQTVYARAKQTPNASGVTNVKSVKISANNATHSISISNSSSGIWTTDHALSGWTNLSRLVSQFNAAKSDSELVVFKVTCGGTEKVFYCEP